ncbi:hypothetical protein [Lysobacter humi (ex Lee et al. 2017)]
MTIDRMRARRIATAMLPVALLLALGAQSAPPASRPEGGDWSLPVREGALVDLAPAPDGSLLLSWVDGEGASRRLRFARQRGTGWSAPRTVAQGDWFGNAMDTPHVRQTVDGALWATWMRKGASGGHARDVVIARSADGGATWSRPAPVHRDATATEHGFVSMWPVGRDRLGVAWLDGRAKAGHAHSDGAQMLRSAIFDGALRAHGESAVDAKVCDCCHTDVAMTASGPLLVYRDRSDAEVRDIRVVHLAAPRTAAPRDVHRDGWTMPGCPVNGPAVAADGGRVAVAWYTAANGVPEVRVALSDDAGRRFAAPVTLERDAAVLGRVDVSTHRGRTRAVWLREDAAGQSLWLARVDAAEAASAPVRLATLAGRGRAAGMPRLAATADALYAIWTDVERGRPVVRGRRISDR